MGIYNYITNRTVRLPMIVVVFVVMWFFPIVGLIASFVEILFAIMKSINPEEE
jgi:hypothetical protein